MTYEANAGAGLTNGHNTCENVIKSSLHRKKLYFDPRSELWHFFNEVPVRAYGPKYTISEEGRSRMFELGVERSVWKKSFI